MVMVNYERGRHNSFSIGQDVFKTFSCFFFFTLCSGVFPQFQLSSLGIFEASRNPKILHHYFIVQGSNKYFSMLPYFFKKSNFIKEEEKKRAIIEF